MEIRNRKREREGDGENGEGATLATLMSLFAKLAKNL